jgi:hypothetical protein
MRQNRILLSILFSLISAIAFAQSLYHLQYNFHDTSDSTSYHAFLVRNNDGSGLLRIRYTPANDTEDVLVEMDIDEQYAPGVTGVEDTSTLMLKSINPRILTGSSQAKYSLPIFIFKYNFSNDFFAPAGITNSQKNITMSAATYFSWQLMEGAGISKPVVSQFFGEDEDFYLNLFRPVTRGLTTVEKNTRLHLLIVADTLDETIGSSCAKDMARALQTFKGLTDYLGIKYFPKTICGKEYSKKNVQTAVAALKPLTGDIVVFYYTGHGFRTPENLRRFPNLKLKNFKTERKNFRDSLSWIKQSRLDNMTYSLNIEDIFNSIRKKGARFNLVLSDCCNNDIFSVNGKGTKPGGTKGSGVEWSEDNVRMLFLNKTPMSVLATAASSGQKATSNDGFGGFFSYYFKTSMENYSSKLKTNVTWDLVLQDAQKQTVVKANHTYCEKPYIPANICQQNPDYKIVAGR